MKHNQIIRYALEVCWCALNVSRLDIMLYYMLYAHMCLSVHSYPLRSNIHNRKDWQRFVKTWFNQPAKKLRRRNKRVEKAKAQAPRPLNLLRPAVQCPTNKYNGKQRLGRGFTLDELEGAGINKKQALSIGIAVDFRRKNRSEEGYKANVERLNRYKNNLVLFPRKGQKVRKGDSSVEECKAVALESATSTLPLSLKSGSRVRPRKATAEETAAQGTVVKSMRRAHTDVRLKGLRIVRARKQAEEAAKKKK
jgi:large subunit ribosomal protein L13e